jgi:tripartite-type tricarboxylate transporter receptor subunit TctC
MKRLLAAALVIVVSSIMCAQAQTYPSKPVSIIVPFAAGGPSDAIARILVEGMRSSLGQPLIIESVVGAGGSIGTGRVARSAPDGYTLGIGNWGTHVANGAIYSLQFDLLKDFTPVAPLPIEPLMIAVKKAVPASNLIELIAWLKANPNKVSSGTSGVGGPSHVAGLLFEKETGTQFQLVPYRGAGPAMQDLVAALSKKAEIGRCGLPLGIHVRWPVNKGTQPQKLEHQSKGTLPFCSTAIRAKCLWTL